MANQRKAAAEWESYKLRTADESRLEFAAYEKSLIAARLAAEFPDD